MTKTQKTFRWMRPMIALMLFASLFFATMPVFAADDTTAETEASVEFTAGELKLISAPIIDFGSHDISNVEQTYEAASISTNVRISDLRGSGEGWDLMVSLSPFILEDLDEETLQASYISIASPDVKAVNGNAGAPPAAKDSVTLTSDSTETLVLEAGSDEGMGVWDLEFSTENTTLTVKPGTAKEGASTAVLTWSLQSTP